MTAITINGNSFDPATQSSQLMDFGLESADSSQSNYILLQTAAPFDKDQKAELRNLDVKILEYVPNDTYIAYYPENDLTPLRELPYITWAGIYPQQVKVEPILKTNLPAGVAPRVVNAFDPAPAADSPLAHNPKKIEVVLHRNADVEEVTRQIAATAGLDPEAVVADGQKIRLTVSSGRIDGLAGIDGVRNIEEFSGNKLYNDVARVIMRANVVQAAPTDFEGDGEIVAVCDTGLDSGDPATIHRAFQNRLLKLYPLARARASDPHGHGTHVAGSVLGDDVMADGTPIRGTAPKAKLVFQSILDANGGLSLPANLNDLFETPYQVDGARVHTNSWGDQFGDGSYSQQSFEVDEFVWNHRDLVICFAAGNDGADRSASGKISPGSVGAPGTAKNCLTVGASESERPLSLTYHQISSTHFPVNPIASDLIADNREGVAAFSGRGPTRDHRIKPDVVAPGSAILSARSQLAVANPLWGISPDPRYMFDTGTSMATPLVAGCVAVVRESFRRLRQLEPSAALVKAMLINGAFPLKGQYLPPELAAVPNESEGFGRIDLASSLAPADGAANEFFWDEQTALDVGDEETRQLTVPPGAAGLKVTLVWTDPPGEALQNDLDLIVKDANGVERHGNMPPSTAAFDRSNNVEQVIWENIAAGEIEITVRAFRIPVHEQSYALVARFF